MTRKIPCNIRPCVPGERFGRWTVVREADRTPARGNRQAQVRCDCGQVRAVRLGQLWSGRSRSCGCLRHDVSPKNKTHGLSQTKEHRIWRGMIERCSRPLGKPWDRYGGRGIRVCPRWSVVGGEGFMAFLSDMGRRPSPEHTIDRIDNDGDYTPENCRWATRAEQANNTSRSRFIEHDGRVQTLQQWADETGIGRECIAWRLNHGWPASRALTAPARDLAQAAEAAGVEVACA